MKRQSSRLFRFGFNLSLIIILFGYFESVANAACGPNAQLINPNGLVFDNSNQNLYLANSGGNEVPRTCCQRHPESRDCRYYNSIVENFWWPPPTGYPKYCVGPVTSSFPWGTTDQIQNPEGVAAHSFDEVYVSNSSAKIITEYGVVYSRPNWHYP